jgi:hypothetical protein
MYGNVTIAFSDRPDRPVQAPGVLATARIAMLAHADAPRTLTLRRNPDPASPDRYLLEDGGTVAGCGRFGEAIGGFFAAVAARLDAIARQATDVATDAEPG